MKRVSFRQSLVCGLMLLLLSALAPAAQADSLYGMVTGGNLHLRASDTASSASLGLYPSGTWVEIVSSGSVWCYVRTPSDRLGYMATRYLILDDASSLSAGTVRNPNGYVNLRSYASMNAQVLGRYQPGTSVQILSRLSTGWTQVRIGDTVGYMVSDFVQSDRPTQSGHVISRYGGRINLRSEPDDNASILTSLPTGTNVTILLAGKSWHKISANGYTGFMAAQYISTAGSSSSTLSAVVKNPRATQVLNLRAQPSLDAKVLGYYANGTQVRVVSKGTTWCEVYVGAQHGYMMTPYLDFRSGSGVTAALYNPNGGSIVNMRADASLSSSITGVFAVGTPVTVLRRGTDWSYVTIGSQSGYVSTYFIR